MTIYTIYVINSAYQLAITTKLKYGGLVYERKDFPNFPAAPGRNYCKVPYTISYL